MSLFKLEEWWSAKAAGEEFVSTGLCLANIDNEATGQEKIITGSLHGILRVYYPKSRESRVEDLMLEQNLDHPILQVETGQFLPSSPDLGLAVLHPRMLVVYIVKAVGGDGASASYYKLEKAYSHSFGVNGKHFTAYCMTFGPFGNVYGKDYICVQAMDGQLAFFEQDRPSFLRFLPQCLLPQPILYFPKIDSFITVSAERTVEAYKYQVLATSTEERREEDDEDAAVEGKSAAPSQFRTHRYCNVLGSGENDVIVIGDHTLFCITESGAIRLQKRLDYHPMAACLYDRCDPESVPNNQNLIIASHTNHLQVMKDMQLVWSAKAPVGVPVAVAVSSFGGVPGMVVTMEGAGRLAVNYLGTTPPSHGVGTLGTGKGMDYEAMDKEHGKLLQIIREAQESSQIEPSDRVLIRVQVPQTIDAVADARDGIRDVGGVPVVVGRGGALRVTVRLFISYTGSKTLENVHITLHPPKCVSVREEAVLLPQLLGGGHTPMIVPLTFFVADGMIPGSLQVKIAVAFTSAKGDLRTTTTSFSLPLPLVSTITAPVKNSSHKFTLETSRPPVSLLSLFEDMFVQPDMSQAASAQISSTASNVLSFCYRGFVRGGDCTILVSRSALTGRYRVQAGTLASLWLVSSELVRRLKKYFSRERPEGRSSEMAPAGAEDDEPFVIAYQEPLPLADYFSCVEDHFSARKALVSSEAKLANLSQQFRVIQKRLLVRFKDRNPAPLNKLDLLMQHTLDHIIDAGNTVSEAQLVLSHAQNKLSCATRLLLVLMQCRFGLESSAMTILESHFSPEVIDTQEHGWEECIDAALTHLLRTVLAKKQRLDAPSVQPPLSMPDDCGKLQKRISIVCDRLSKGASLVFRGEEDE